MVNASELIKIKTAIVLNEMLAEAQSRGTKYARINDRKIEIHNSIGKISVETGITKTGIAAILNAKNAAKITTLLPILTTLNKSLTDFSKRFDKITDSDIQKFKERISAKQHPPAKPKSSRK